MSDNKLIVLWAIGAISVAPIVILELLPHVKRGRLGSVAMVRIGTNAPRAKIIFSKLQVNIAYFFVSFTLS
jgi:hypothetical protein